VSFSQVIHPGSGKAVPVYEGDIIRIQQTTGGEVADVLFYARGAMDEYVSCSNTIMYNMNLGLPSGSWVFSNRSRKMLRVLEDTVGSNNLFMGCCTLESFQYRYDLEYHPSCHETFTRCLAEFGFPEAAIPPPINFFMGWVYHEDGTLEMGASPAKADDYIELQAEMNLVLVISVCPQEITPTNNFHPTPLKLTIREAEAAPENAAAAKQS
jgi:uncharacterized protein YcgI (DUF1989 family)